MEEYFCVVSKFKRIKRNSVHFKNIGIPEIVTLI